MNNFLLNEGYDVTVFDIQWFGNYLKKHPEFLNNKYKNSSKFGVI